MLSGKSIDVEPHHLDKHAHFPLIFQKILWAVMKNPASNPSYDWETTVKRFDRLPALTDTAPRKTRQEVASFRRMIRRIPARDLEERLTLKTWQPPWKSSLAFVRMEAERATGAKNDCFEVAISRTQILEKLLKNWKIFSVHYSILKCKMIP